MAKAEFIEFDTITDVDGVALAVLTYRIKPSGQKMYSFMIVREFDDAGVKRRTPWMNGRHVDAMARMLPRVLARLNEEETKEKSA